MARRHRNYGGRRKRNKKTGERYTHETDTYKAQVKTGAHVVVRDKHTPHNNLIFTERSKLQEFIDMLNKLKQKL